MLDREVLYLIVERDRQQLMSPEDLRRLDQQSRWKAFQDQLRKNPDRPDLRLLNPGTIRVPEDLASKVVVVKDRPQLGVRATGPDATLKRFVVDHASKNWREIDPVTVRGRLVYLDFEGTWRPLVNASVNLYDDDTFGDEHLGTTVTDFNGNWSFNVDNDDGWLADGRDIYYASTLATRAGTCTTTTATTIVGNRRPTTISAMVPFSTTASEPASRCHGHAGFRRHQPGLDPHHVERWAGPWIHRESGIPLRKQSHSGSRQHRGGDVDGPDTSCMNTVTA